MAVAVATELDGLPTRTKHKRSLPSNKPGYCYCYMVQDLQLLHLYITCLFQLPSYTRRAADVAPAACSACITTLK